MKGRLWMMGLYLSYLYQSSTKFSPGMKTNSRYRCPSSTFKARILIWSCPFACGLEAEHRWTTELSTFITKHLYWLSSCIPGCLCRLKADIPPQTIEVEWSRYSLEVATFSSVMETTSPELVKSDNWALFSSCPQPQFYCLAQAIVISLLGSYSSLPPHVPALMLSLHQSVTHTVARSNYTSFLLKSWL